MPSQPGWDLYRPIAAATGAASPDFLRFLHAVRDKAQAAQPVLTPQPIAAAIPTDGTATDDDRDALLNSIRAALVAWGLAA